MGSPIIRFKSNEQFQKCCKEWQHRLFLDSWFIKFVLTDKIIEYEDGTVLDGENAFNYNNKEARITIFNGTYDFDDKEYVNVTKQIAELVVIHELLHIKEEYLLDKDIINKDVEGHQKYNAHQSLESMAKTLLMTKYNLDYTYFMEG